MSSEEEDTDAKIGLDKAVFGVYVSKEHGPAGALNIGDALVEAGYTVHSVQRLDIQGMEVLNETERVMEALDEREE